MKDANTQMGKIPTSTTHIFHEPVMKEMPKAQMTVTTFCTIRPKFWYIRGGRRRKRRKRRGEEEAL